MAATVNRIAAANGAAKHVETDGVNMTEQLRGLLIEWEKFARSMAAAGVIALPDRLLNKTTGLLDATAV